jgi:ribosomal protein S18 acetylase RimI-like enzyme
MLRGSGGMRARRRLAKYVRDWKTFPGDASLAYQRGGVRDAWEEFARRTIYRLVEAGRCVVFAQPLDRLPDIPPPEGVSISLMNEAGCDALATLVSPPELDRFRARLATGRHCLVAWRGIRPIGYGWVADRVGPDVTLVPLPLPPDAAYLWDLYVSPAERCNGIGSAVASARCQLARARGFREGWRMIAASNHPSIRTLVRSGPGARVVGEIRFIKLITRMYARFTPSTIPAGQPR